MATWTVQPRDSTLHRSYDPIQYWSSLTVIERHNVSDQSGTAAGTWSVTGATQGMNGLLTPGNGAIFFRDDVPIMSGPITSISRGEIVSTVSGFGDLEILNDRILYPSPANPITSQSTAYDNRSGAAETVLLGYVNANIGPGAYAARRVSSLRLPADQGRGGAAAVTISGRLEQLGTTVSDIAEMGGFHVDIIQMEDSSGPYLQLTIDPVVDRSANVRFGPVSDFTGGLMGSGWSYELKRPTVTDAVSAGGGVGVNRVFIEQVDADAESLWAAKVEIVVDQRQTTDPVQLTQAAQNALASGANPVAVAFTITDSPDIQYRRDWKIGDKVGVFVDGMDLSDVVREVTTTVANSSGQPSEVISAVVGSRDSSNWVDRPNRDVAKALHELKLLKAS
jgi:hypothetical protein